MSAVFSRKMREIAQRWDLLRSEYHQEETDESPTLLSLYDLHAKPILVERIEPYREPIKMISSPAA